MLDSLDDMFAIQISDDDGQYADDADNHGAYRTHPAELLKVHGHSFDDEQDYQENGKHKSLLPLCVLHVPDELNYCVKSSGGRLGLDAKEVLELSEHDDESCAAGETRGDGVRKESSKGIKLEDRHEQVKETNHESTLHINRPIFHTTASITTLI
jgi:hypothetical protein